MIALDGIKVIDFGMFFAGPFASRLLADLGADVIKVESLTGDTLRRTAGAFNAAQRGKRAIALDLKGEEGRAIAHRLIAEADVVQHNMRPGVAERLGIDYATLQRINSRLIYLYSPGYGNRGPRTNQGSFEPLVSGLTGIQDISTPPGHPPNMAMHGNMDYGNAQLGAIAIMLALLHRDRTGQGQYIECAQMSSGMFCTAEAYWLPGGALAPQLRLDADMNGVGPLMRLYQAGDGEWLCIVCHTDDEWRRLAAAVGLETLVEDPRFRTWHSRREHGGELAEALAGAFRRRGAREWFELLDGAGVPCELPTDRAAERFLDDPESQRRDWTADYEHPTYGTMREVGQVLRFTEARGRIRGPAPTIGQHTEEILAELGYSPEEVRAMEERGIARCTLESGAVF